MSEARQLERREILRLGAAGFAAGALGGCAAGAPAMAPAPAAPAAPPAAAISPAPVDPTRRVLGRTGLTVPVVNMGVMNADNPNLVRAALDGGMTLLDTAHGYQGGRNEEMLGTVLAGRPRESFILCTKVFLSTLDRKTGLFSPATRAAELGEKLDLSLARLGLEYVDVLYLHNQSRRESTQLAPMLEALAAAKRAGKARFVGVSTHKNEPDVIRAAIEAEVYDVVLTAYNFRQDHHREVEQAMTEAAAAGLGVVVMKTQAGVYWDDERLRPIDARAALRWAIRNPSVHTAIPGFTTFDQLQLDLEVLRQPAFSAADEQALSAPPLAGFFCQGCEQCLEACGARLPIPELMRGYMYAHAYRNRLAARHLLDALALPAAPCAACDGCTVVCAKGFDVRARVRDVARLRDVPVEFLT